uniref:Uncharacterized protein n=1 Tax=Phasianus colchicus TaxID=9054 RepID=A0A669QPZ3_PHACC
MSCFPELYFNVDNGYLEGLVRGFKAGVLRQGDYVNLVQCESLEGERGSAGPGGAPAPSRPRAEGRACCEGLTASLGLCPALLCVSTPGNLFDTLLL